MCRIESWQGTRNHRGTTGQAGRAMRGNTSKSRSPEKPAPGYRNPCMQFTKSGDLSKSKPSHQICFAAAPVFSPALCRRPKHTTPRHEPMMAQPPHKQAKPIGVFLAPLFVSLYTQTHNFWAFARFGFAAGETSPYVLLSDESREERGPPRTRARTPKTRHVGQICQAMHQGTCLIMSST